MPRSFTVSDEDFLRLHDSGLNATEIAEALGFSVRNVQRYRSRLGVVQHVPRAAWRPGPEWEAQASSLIADGASIREVARTMGCHQDTVIRRFRGKGWTLQQAGAHSQAMGRANKLFSTIREASNV